MQRFIYITIVYLLLSISVPSLSFSGQHVQIPGSPRARHVIARLSPLLKIRFSQKGLELGNPIFIRIFKKEKVLELWSKNNDTYQLYEAYPVCTYGFQGFGPKIREGDGKAPEGFYFIRPASLNPHSQFHLSFNLGYPNHYDRIHGRTGSALMVHGSCVSIGCYAMTDSRMEEIYTIADAAFRNGQGVIRVHIFPFKMSDENIRKYQKSEWYSFWLNLKEGYDYFENKGNMPPNVGVENHRYIFNESL